MLYVIGLGLGDEKDISVKGLEAVKKCDKVYIEAYTSLLSFGISSSGISTLEEFYGKPVIVADREMVEERADNMLLESRTSNVAFLVVGDPFGATTHTDLVVRAKKEGIEVKVIHNASVMNAVGVCGLQLYRYGETVSIPFFTDTWRPDSFYEKIKRNRSLELHTLCLLDIRVKEPSMESLARENFLSSAPKAKDRPKQLSTVGSKLDNLVDFLIFFFFFLLRCDFISSQSCLSVPSFFSLSGSHDQGIYSGFIRIIMVIFFFEELPDV
ncbi:diphthine methyl ester synthase [Ranunculus cassubicifolius]